MRRTHWMTALLVGGLCLGGAALAGPKDKGELPPGLQKKLQRGGELPPGWKDKLQVGQPLDRELFERHGVILRPVNDAGIIEVRIDDEVLHLLHHSLEIVDILSR